MRYESNLVSCPASVVFKQRRVVGLDVSPASMAGHSLMCSDLAAGPAHAPVPAS